MGSALTAVDEVSDELRIHLLNLMNLKIFLLLSLTGKLLPLLLMLSYLSCQGQLNKKVSILCQALNTR